MEKTINAYPNKKAVVPEQPEAGVIYQHSGGGLWIGTVNQHLLGLKNGTFWALGKGGFGESHSDFEVFEGKLVIKQELAE